VSRLERAAPRTDVQPFCVCGYLEARCKCREFVAKTPKNDWVKPCGLRGHSQVAPCTCPSCDADVRAILARGREEYGLNAEEVRARREAIEAQSPHSRKAIRQQKEAVKF
jgi:hypothetical protein